MPWCYLVPQLSLPGPQPLMPSPIVHGASRVGEDAIALQDEDAVTTEQNRREGLGLSYLHRLIYSWVSHRISGLPTGGMSGAYWCFFCCTVKGKMSDNRGRMSTSNSEEVACSSITGTSQLATLLA